jgi:hypothetical protein
MERATPELKKRKAMKAKLATIATGLIGPDQVVQGGHTAFGLGFGNVLKPKEIRQNTYRLAKREPTECRAMGSDFKLPEKQKKK